LSSRIRCSVAERVVTNVSKRRKPSTEPHSITPHKTIPLMDFFPSHPRYRYSPSLIRSVKMHTAAPLLPWIQNPIPLVKLQLLSGTEEFSISRTINVFMTVRRTEIRRARGIKRSVHCTDVCIKRLETFRQQSDHRIYRLNPSWSSSGPAAVPCNSTKESATASPCLPSQPTFRPLLTPPGGHCTTAPSSIRACSDRYINFKAAPFNIVRPDVNISFMWAKHNPVRELAGGGSAAGK